MFPVIVASAVFVLYNALFLYKGWPFILAIMLELVIAFAMFVWLLRLLWDEPAV
jgi:hypothetical protein